MAYLLIAVTFAFIQLSNGNGFELGPPMENRRPGPAIESDPARPMITFNDRPQIFHKTDAIALFNPDFSKLFHRPGDYRQRHHFGRRSGHHRGHRRGHHFGRHFEHHRGHRRFGYHDRFRPQHNPFIRHRWPAHIGHNINRLPPFAVLFDYKRGCCRKRFEGCHRPLCNDEGFDYYDEVRHCCHRHVSGCNHRPLCEFGSSFYDRDQQCCRKRGPGCHRPQCSHRRSRSRSHSRSSSSDSSDDSSRSHDRDDSHSNSGSHSDERRHRTYLDCRRPCSGSHCDHRCRRVNRHSSSSSSDHSGNKVHRRKGHRSKEIKSNYPAYFPYMFHNNGTRQEVKQNVHVNVHQTSNLGYKDGKCNGQGGKC